MTAENQQRLAEGIAALARQQPPSCLRCTQRKPKSRRPHSRPRTRSLCMSLPRSHRPRKNHRTRFFKRPGRIFSHALCRLPQSPGRTSRPEPEEDLPDSGQRVGMAIPKSLPSPAEEKPSIAPAPKAMPKVRTQPSSKQRSSQPAPDAPSESKTGPVADLPLPSPSTRQCPVEEPPCKWPPCPDSRFHEPLPHIGHEGWFWDGSWWFNHKRVAWQTPSAPWPHLPTPSQHSDHRPQENRHAVEQLERCILNPALRLPCTCRTARVGELARCYYMDDQRRLCCALPCATRHCPYNSACGRLIDVSRSLSDDSRSSHYCSRCYERHERY